MKKVYVLVCVQYDYFRFPENYGVFSSRKKAYEYAIKQNLGEIIHDSMNVPEIEKLDEKSIAHWEIEQWDLNPIK